MRQFVAVAVLALAATALVACAEESSSPEPSTYTVTIEAEDGSTFAVTAEESFGWTPEQVMSYLANIEIERVDPSSAPSMDPQGVYGAVPAATPTVERVAIEGGFKITVEPLARVDKLDDWRWDFADMGHAQGHCPGM